MSTQNKNFFFTSVPGTDRFLSGDEPTQAVMEDFTDSVPFKLEATDTATELQQGLVESATQTEYDTSIDNNGLGYALFVRPSFIKTAFTDLEALLQAQIDAINTLIINIQGDISTIQASIIVMQGDITTLQGDVTTLTTNIDNSMPIGTMILFPLDTPPNADWLHCDGTSYPTGTYPDLYTVIGTNFGGGGGNFNVPDTRAQFIAGYDQFGAVEYATVGGGMGDKHSMPQQNTIVLDPSQAAVPNHSHGLTTNVATISIGKNVNETKDFMRITTATNNSGQAADEVRMRCKAKDGATTGDQRQIENAGSGAPGDAHNHWFTASTNPSDGVTVGGSTDTDGLISSPSAHENRPDFTVFPYYIKAQ